MKTPTKSRTTSVPKGPLKLMYMVYKHILPEVRSELARWREKAESIPDVELRTQAIASMSCKQFHCEGGSVYALISLQDCKVLIPLIVAFQTISDYLDNLCDRSTSLDPEDFRMLHQSMLDAVDPKRPIHDYYAYRNEKEDEGYLTDLVRTCQSALDKLPSFLVAAPSIRELVSLYCDLQVYKHIRKDLREEALLTWWNQHQVRYPKLRWNEFAAATGSTLGVFMLFASAANPNLTLQTVKQIMNAYFPFICGLHIQLDYLIDQQEDVEGGDLNFCAYYGDTDVTVDRIGFIVEQARATAAKLEHPKFHRMIIEGLLALYLSDPKIRTQSEVLSISKRLMRKSPMARTFFMFNSMFIRSTS